METIKDSTQITIKNTTLKNFLESHPCCPAPPRPNTTVQFQIADTSQPPLINSPSPLYRPAWAALLEAYPGDLPTAIDNILRFGCLVGYSGSDKYIDHRISEDGLRGTEPAMMNQGSL